MHFTASLNFRHIPLLQSTTKSGYLQRDDPSGVLAEIESLESVEGRQGGRRDVAMILRLRRPESGRQYSHEQVYATHINAGS